MSSIVLVAVLALAADPAAPVDPAAGPGGQAAAPAAAETAAPEECDCDGIGRTGALAVLGGGLLFGVTSLVAFNAGFEAERQLRAGEARGVDEQNTALTQRAVSAWVAWPTAVLAVAGVLGGGWLVAEDGAP